jgi:hypothetical protein
MSIPASIKILIQAYLGYCVTQTRTSTPGYIVERACREELVTSRTENKVQNFNFCFQSSAWHRPRLSLAASPGSPKKAKKKSAGGRAFGVCAPRLWNALPVSLRNIQIYNSFKSVLKTHLFNEAFQQF